MKDTAIDRSIAAALQACAAQANTDRPVRQALGAAGDRRAASPAHLTQRQLEVLALLCEGLPNKLICRRLNIAAGTVKVHISCILRELGVTSRLQAVVEAQSSGLHARLPSGTFETAAGAGAMGCAAGLREHPGSTLVGLGI